MKEEYNNELLKELDKYLEDMTPEELFREIEERYPDGIALSELFSK